MINQTFDTFKIGYQKNIPVLTFQEKRIYLQLSEKFKEEIGEFLVNGGKNLILDLSDVNVMNSAALGVLIALQSDIEKRKGRMSIVGLQPLMEEIFSRMRLELIFDIDKSVESAASKFA